MVQWGNKLQSASVLRTHASRKKKKRAKYQQIGFSTNFEKAGWMLLGMPQASPCGSLFPLYYHCCALSRVVLSLRQCFMLNAGLKRCKLHPRASAIQKPHVAGQFLLLGKVSLMPKVVTQHKTSDPRAVSEEKGSTSSESTSSVA